MSPLFTVDRTGDTPIYRQIADQLRSAIVSGQLPPGAQLPTVRQLAQELSVTRLTVQNAYADLQSGGWIESTVGRGTFVSEQAPMQAPMQLHWRAASRSPTPALVIGDILQMGQAQGIRSFASASPDPSLFPETKFWECLEAQRSQTKIVVSYGAAQGDALLRSEFVAYLAERSVVAGPDEILVVSGVTQGLALVAQLLTQPGDCVLVEQPTYVGLLHLLRTQGLQPIAAPMDEEGPILEEVERLATAHRPRFFYTVPGFQNPTGYQMTTERRQRLLELAQRCNFYIVEDDIYSLMAYDAPPLPPIKAFDRTERVFYITSFSKTLMPGLRLGMVMAPPPFRERLIAARIAADLGSPPLLQRTLATFLHRGEFRRHLRQTIPTYRERRNAMLRALENFMPAGVTWTRPAGGFCCWLTLPRHPGMGDAPNLVLQQGWAVAPGNVFLADGNGDFHLRLCFGALTPDNIRQGVRLVGEVIRRQLAVEPSAPEMSGEWMPLV